MKSVLACDILQLTLVRHLSFLPRSLGWQIVHGLNIVFTKLKSTPSIELQNNSLDQFQILLFVAMMEYKKHQRKKYKTVLDV